MNWNFFKTADVESKDRLKCGQCHVYLPENYLDAKCEYCLGIKSRKIKVHKPEPVPGPTAEPGPVQDLDLELHGSEPLATAEPGPSAERVNWIGLCEKCGATVPGLVSRFCINCSIQVIHSE